MSDLMQSIDDRTQLAGSNRLEVLTFTLKPHDEAGHNEFYGINVFKVRELMTVPQLTRIPAAPEYMVGLANIRGTAVPVIDLRRYCGIESLDEPKLLIVTEFNRSTQGFLTDAVVGIEALDWNDVQPPPELNNEGNNSTITAISELKDGRMLLILDVEKVISDVLGSALSELDKTDAATSLDQRMVYFVDDSGVARLQVSKLLDHLSVPHRSANNGQEALTALKHMADAAEREGVSLSTRLQAIITDVEMPIMDGYVLTRRIKEDKRFDGIPVMMHSSLSSSENKRLGMSVGADGYIPKLRPQEFEAELVKLIQGAATDKAA